LTDFHIGGTVVGGGVRVRKRRQAIINKQAFMPALTLAALPNPSFRNKLLSMIG
jgi:hypothetical protein